MSGKLPKGPTNIYRIVHKECLRTLLTRGVLYSPNLTPDDGLPYRTIHNESVQANRRVRSVPGGPIHDYVPFYFGPLSVMLLNLKTGHVQGYEDGQEPIVYLVSSVQSIAQAGLPFVFSDGHGLASFTDWFDDPANLKAVDWDIVAARYWADSLDDNDRQRRKQAEFLVHRTVPWELISEVGVHNNSVQKQVADLLLKFPNRSHPPVNVRPEWYYH